MVPELELPVGLDWGGDVGNRNGVCAVPLLQLGGLQGMGGPATVSLSTTESTCFVLPEPFLVIVLKPLCFDAILLPGGKGWSAIVSFLSFAGPVWSEGEQ